MTEFIEILEIEQQRIRHEKCVLFKIGRTLLQRLDELDKRDKEIDEQIKVLDLMPEIPKEQKIRRDAMKIYALRKIHGSNNNEAI